jgi:hypothetical protein
MELSNPVDICYRVNSTKIKERSESRSARCHAKVGQKTHTATEFYFYSYTIMAPSAPVSALVIMKETFDVDSPASIPTDASCLKGVAATIPMFELPFSATSSSSVWDENLSSTLGAPCELQTLSRKINRLLSFEQQSKLEANAAPSETLQACALSLRTRVPLFLRRTETPCRSALALLRAREYVNRIQEGMDGSGDANKTLDVQLRTVLSGLDVASLPMAFQKQLSFRVSPWVQGFDLPVGATACTELVATWEQSPLLVEVEPVVEFRTDDATSVDYARRAAQACQVTILKCRHVASNVGAGFGVVGEATIRIQVTPVGEKPLLDDQGRAQSLQVKEARVYVVS